MIKKIISGGQTGADQGGLFGARDAGFPTGGYAPKNFLTEDGSCPRLLQDFGLVDSGLDYVGRTALNVRHSDITIWFGKANSPGFYATKRAATSESKPFLEARVFGDVQSANGVSLSELMNDYSIINVAGNRESGNPGIFDVTRMRVHRALEIIMEHEGVK